MTTTTIKIRNDDLLVAKTALERIKDLKLPIKAAYAVSKLHKILAGEIEPFEEQRISLVKSLGEVPEGEKHFIIAPGTENYKTFIEEIKKLQEIEIEVIFTPLDLDQFGEAETESNILSALMPFLKE